MQTKKSQARIRMGRAIDVAEVEGLIRRMGARGAHKRANVIRRNDRAAWDAPRVMRPQALDKVDRNET